MPFCCFRTEVQAPLWPVLRARLLPVLPVLQPMDAKCLKALHHSHDKSRIELAAGTGVGELLQQGVKWLLCFHNH